MRLGPRAKSEDKVDAEITRRVSVAVDAVASEPFLPLPIPCCREKYREYSFEGRQFVR
jgi:hypothetical protein